MLADQTVTQVKAYTDLVPVIGDYVQLKKKGRNFVGLCPFHSEKTGSFVVSPEKHIFHCFGCHESGNLISFIMKIENLNFIEAVKFIAHKVGIEIIEEQRDPELSKKEALNKQIRDALYDTKEKLRECLKSDSTGYKYLESRGISSQSIQTFQLGYFPPDLDMWTYLSKRGYSDTVIAQTGIFFETDNGVWVSRFRNRVMFPLLDHLARTIGFAGRTLSDDSRQAKYVNSPESDIFNKRRTVYAMDKAKKPIKDKKAVILMEGYMDVIVAHQHGFTNTVATMGTALTTQHAQLLRRFTDTAMIALDSDDAGQAAAQKSVESLQDEGLAVTVIQYPEKDPADCIQKRGAEAFQGHIDAAKNVAEFQFSSLLSQHPNPSIHDKSKIIDAMVPLLQKEQDIIVQNHYVSMIATQLNIDPELILAKIKNIKYNVGTRTSSPVQRNKKSKYEKAEEHVIHLAATSLDFRQQILDKQLSHAFQSALLKSLLNTITSSQLSNAELVDSISDPELKNQLSRILLSSENQESQAEQMFADCCALLETKSDKQRIIDIKQQIKVKEAEGDHDTVTSLLHELASLKR